MIPNDRPDITRAPFVFIIVNEIFKKHTKSIFLKQKAKEMKLKRHKRYF
jgi:hypothetical protein